MTEPTQPSAASGAAPAPAIDSRAAFLAALHWGLQTAIERGARSILWSDAGFGDWPLDDPAWLAPLPAWLRRPKRRLTLLAADYAELPRRHPRFTGWRRDWAHGIDCWQPTPDLAGEVPTLLLDDTGVSVHLIDAVHWRGRAALDEQTASLWRERIDVLLQRSEPAFPVSTLGL
ncbi:MAG: hypothetical protein KF683_13255 [Rubrivivax sp.]|nr:hypothetical protein [Rubrivivax sp.]